jgi:hypothetical protein
MVVGSSAVARNCAGAFGPRWIRGAGRVARWKDPRPLLQRLVVDRHESYGLKSLLVDNFIPVTWMLLGSSPLVE